MSGRSALTAILGLVLLIMSFDAEAARRGLRIDFGDWTDAFTLGSENCPGSAPGSPAVFWGGFEFNGGSTMGTYSVDEYCQQALEFDPENPDDPFFSENSLLQPGDEGLADKVGPNNDPNPLNRVTANRFTFLDRDRFDDPPPMGYQWEFYFFPGDITLVRLNGEIPVPGPDFSPYIEDDLGIIWDGEVSGYDGEYWCFDNGFYVGTWDGEPAGPAPLAGCGFASGCYELVLIREGTGGLPLTSPRNSPDCPIDFYMPDEVITLTAQPAPGFKVSGWSGTDDDVCCPLVNQLTFPAPRGSGKGEWYVTVFYEDALVCPQGTVEQTWLSEDMENGEGGWTHSATVGGDTWALQSEHSVSPDNAWNGQGVETASDQRLVSPAVSIPENITFARLSYYNRRDFDEGIDCFDGGILEYSTNGGTDWTWFPFDDFETDAYNGFTQWPTGYPSPPEQNGWCGQAPWTLAEVDISPLAGETLNFRFRFGTDDFGPVTEGWWIDDVQVSGCLADVIFDNNFEAP